MPKYGLFTGPKKIPDQTFEGDYMLQDGEYVKIQVKPKSDNDTGRTVASIRLDKGQVVKEIEHAPAQPAGFNPRIDSR